MTTNSCRPSSGIFKNIATAWTPAGSHAFSEKSCLNEYVSSVQACSGIRSSQTVAALSDIKPVSCVDFISLLGTFKIQLRKQRWFIDWKVLNVLLTGTKIEFEDSIFPAKTLFYIFRPPASLSLFHIACSQESPPCLYYLLQNNRYVLSKHARCSWEWKKI